VRFPRGFVKGGHARVPSLNHISPPRTNGEARGSLVLARLVEAGFARIEPSLLQPASVFLDLSGEEMRGRLYLTTDADGAELCLRPEYTIPVCRAYLASPEAGSEAQFSYLGPVFRARPGQSGERVQGGLESYGRTDIEAADAEIFALAMEAAAAADAPPLSVRLGDAGLFDGVLRALDLPDVWLRRLRRGLARGRGVEAILAEAGNGSGAEQSGVLAALERADHAGAKALVEDLLSIAGISSVGGRSPGEIADRFLEQSALRSGSSVPAEKRQVLKAFLAIVGDPDSASARLRALAADAKLDIRPALDALDERTGFFAARGVRVEDCVFAAAFVRDIDYYTGFVFEARGRNMADERPIIVGGRYDRLARRLGAARDIPAVGAALWIDRLGETSPGSAR
jgi:ATP phosphoribosyltransferase regulatory subunit